MKNQLKCGEVSVDLKMLVVTYLKLWKSVLAAMAAGAVVMVLCKIFAGPSVWYQVIKSGVVGVVLGALAIACWVILVFVVSDKMNGAVELSERYGIFVLGSIYKPTEMEKKVNRFLKVDEEVDTQAEYELIAAKLWSVCTQDAQEILVTGTVSEDVLQEVCYEVGKYVQDQSFAIKAVSNPVYNAETTRLTKNAKVVLVEAKGASNVKKIEKLIVQLGASNAEIVGAIEV